MTARRFNTFILFLLLCVRARVDAQGRALRSKVDASNMADVASGSTEAAVSKETNDRKMLMTEKDPMETHDRKMTMMDKESKVTNDVERAMMDGTNGSDKGTKESIDRKTSMVDVAKGSATAINKDIKQSNDLKMTMVDVAKGSITAINKDTMESNDRKITMVDVAKGSATTINKETEESNDHNADIVQGTSFKGNYPVDIGERVIANEPTLGSNYEAKASEERTESQANSEPWKHGKGQAIHPQETSKDMPLKGPDVGNASMNAIHLDSKQKTFLRHTSHGGSSTEQQQGLDMTGQTAIGGQKQERTIHAYDMDQDTQYYRTSVTVAQFQSNGINSGRDLLATNGISSSQAYPTMDLSSIDLFNPADQQLFVDFATKTKAATEQEAIQPLFNSERPVASLCARDANCAQGLSCIANRCLPSTGSCLAAATNDFITAFDEAAWKANLYETTGLSKEQIANSTKTSIGWEAFQHSSTFNQLKAAARDSLPMEQGRLLQNAVDACDADRQDGRGTKVYLAIHAEISAGIDIAATILWTVGGATIEFTRGTFGGEFGAGAELSFLVGFIFTNEELTELDLAGGAIVTDFDIGFGLHTGLTVINNLNKLVSIELAVGPGVGGGVGVGYSITAITRGITSPPTQGPVSAPAPTAPTGGGGGGPTATACNLISGCFFGTKQPLNNADLNGAIFFASGSAFSRATTTYDFEDMSSDISKDYGYPIGVWNVAAVLDMSYVFEDYDGPGNLNLKFWNTAAVTTMKSMFKGASSFNGDLSGWNTALVADMSYMFNAAAFNGNISNWNTAAVTDMNYMFGSSDFNRDIPNWNTKKVGNMFSMFYDTGDFNADISNWNTAAVTNMEYMFYEASNFNRDISNWNTAAVTNMHYMFGYSAFNRDIPNWNTEKVGNMESMFYEAVYFNADVSNWNTAAVTTMASMFYYASNFNRDISNWNTAAVTSMSTMFEDAVEFNRDISNWNTAAVTRMSFMFEDAVEFNRDISNWNTASVTSMLRMFEGASKFNIDISGWDVSSVSTLERMFYYASAFNGNISPWNTASVANMASMFESAIAFNQNLSAWRPANSAVLTEMFNGAENYQQGFCDWYPVPTMSPNGPGSVVGMLANTKCDTAGQATFDSLCPCTTPVSQAPSVSAAPSKQPSLAPSTSSMPSKATATCVPGSTPGTKAFSADGVDLVVARATKSDGTTNDFTLSNSQVSQDYGYPIGAWNVAGVQSMSQLFLYYSGPDILDLQCWNTAAVTNMSGMFGAVTFNANVSSWNVSNVSDMNNMFSGAVSFNANIASWNVSNVTNMSNMFAIASVFNANIGTWDVSNVTNMDYMFSSASLFNQNIGTWNVSKVSDMKGMFLSAIAFNQNISAWGPANSASMNKMFFGASNYQQGFCEWYSGGDNPSDVTDMLDGTMCDAMGSTFPALCPCTSPV